MLSRIVAVSALLAAAGCATLPGERLSSDASKQLRELIDQTVTENGVAGYSIALLRDGELVFETSGGFANVEHQVPISDRSRYQIYSASKLFFNVAFMQLIEMGKIHPDDKLGVYLPQLPLAWRELTVRQTWSHMTGTTDILDLSGMEPTAEAALASVIEIPLRFEPGTQTEYNQTNFLLLKMVFEKASGRKYAEALRDQILAPVGLQDIPFGDLSLVAPDLTTNYEAHEFEERQLGRRSIKFPPYVYTSAGINITLTEFVRWWRAVLAEEYVSQQTLERFWEPSRRANGELSYRSNGWEREQQDGRVRIGHGGGARIHLFHYLPDRDERATVTVIFLTNGGAKFFDHRHFADEMATLVEANAVMVGR